MVFFILVFTVAISCHAFQQCAPKLRFTKEKATFITGVTGMRYAHFTFVLNRSKQIILSLYGFFLHALIQRLLGGLQAAIPKAPCSSGLGKWLLTTPGKVFPQVYLTLIGCFVNIAQRRMVGQQKKYSYPLGTLPYRLGSLTTCLHHQVIFRRSYLLVTAYFLYMCNI